MSRVLPFLLLGVVACSDFAYPATPPEPPPYEGPMFTASGMVIDSLSGEVLRGVRVASGEQITFSDESGAWWLDVPPGEATFSTSPAGYERASLALTVKSSLYVTILVRRNAPLVRECYREGDRIYATLTDLQGRKSIERWTRSSATFDTPGGPIKQMASTWQYLPPPDYYDWPISIGPVPAAATGVRWDLYDSEGNRFAGACEVATSGDA